MVELIEIAQSIASAARSNEDVEAYVSWHRDTDIRVYEGETESLSTAESAGIGIRVVSGSRQGFAYVGDLDEGHAREALEEARDNATFATEDPNAGLGSPDGRLPAELELWRDGLAGYSTKQKLDMALELEAMVRAGDSRIRQIVSTDYGDGQGEFAVASSTGISATSRQTTCYLATDVVAGEGDDTQTGDGYTIGREPGDLDVEHAASDAIERSTRLLGAGKPQSQRIDVILDPRVTAILLSVLSSTLSGEEVAKGRSLFNDRIGEQVSVGSFTLVDDPTDSRSYGASRFDSEGLACRRIPLISAGHLVGYLYDSYSARLLSAVSTASAVRAGFKSTPGVGARSLSLEPGELDQNGLIDSLGEGLLVQGISGVHSGVNRVSGDFSVGAEGVMIRSGSIAEPVREITIASTIQRMLQHVVAVGNDIEWLPSSAAGVSLVVADMAMSGT